MTTTESYVQSRVYMDTMVTIQVPDVEVPGTSALVERAFGWFAEAERRCSRFDPESELRQLCGRHGTPVSVSPLLFRALEFALAVAVESNGAFDPSIGRAMEERGFNQNYRTGGRVTSGARRKGASFRDVSLDRISRTVILARPLQLDLGAVAKGLAVDLAAEEFRTLPDFLINAGGDICVHGNGPDSAPWLIGVPLALLAGNAWESGRRMWVAYALSSGRMTLEADAR